MIWVNECYEGGGGYYNQLLRGNATGWFISFQLPWNATSHNEVKEQYPVTIHKLEKINQASGMCLEFSDCFFCFMFVVGL